VRELLQSLVNPQLIVDVTVSRARAIVRGHRRASLLGSVETETAICSENHHTKKPRPRPGLLIRRSLGEISISQQPVHPN
jgi:hypothetical protein